MNTFSRFPCDPVDADRVLAKADLAPARPRRVDLLQLQDLRASGLMNANRAHSSSPKNVAFNENCPLRSAKSPER